MKNDTLPVIPGGTNRIYTSHLVVNDADNNWSELDFTIVKNTAFGQIKLNGQTRNVEVRDKSIKAETKENKKTDKANDKHIGAPLQGMLSKLLVNKGDAVKKNQQLFIIEAMKMETIITAPFDSTIGHIELGGGTLVNTNDLVLELK